MDEISKTCAPGTCWRWGHLPGATTVWLSFPPLQAVCRGSEPILMQLTRYSSFYHLTYEPVAVLRRLQHNCSRFRFQQAPCATWKQIIGVGMKMIVMMMMIIVRIRTLMKMKWMVMVMTVACGILQPGPDHFLHSGQTPSLGATSPDLIIFSLISDKFIQYSYNLKEL